MPRTKGSKNKKSIKDTSTIAEQVAAKQASIAALNGELEEINATIENQKKLAKEKKREIRKAETVLKHLLEKQEEANAIAAASAAKAEIEEVVTQLISSGKSKDEILSLLK